MRLPFQKVKKNIVWRRYRDWNKKRFLPLQTAHTFSLTGNYGIRGKNLFWFISYLTNRTQFIKYNKLNTSFQKIACGVPQGSVLGPLSFLIYVNNPKDASKSLDCIMFIDDTNIFILIKLSRVFLILQIHNWKK